MVHISEDLKKCVDSAVQYYTLNDRIRLFEEEVAELFVASNHLMRNRKDAIYNLIEEWVDVIYVGLQVIKKSGLSEDIVEGVMREKFKKMSKSIKEDMNAGVKR